MKMLNLGCGKKQLRGSGMIGIDHKDYGQEYVLDLETADLPFEDNSIDYIKADQFLEHLTDCRHILNECWRVLKPEGQLEVYVPWGLWENVISPVHKTIMTEYWFQWLEKDDVWELYDYRRWKIEHLKTATRDDGQRYEMHIKMKPYEK